MSSTIQRCVQLLAVFAAIVCTFPVQAGYDFTTIDYPNSALTESYGINNTGHIVGVALLFALNATPSLQRFDKQGIGVHAFAKKCALGSQR